MLWHFYLNWTKKYTGRCVTQRGWQTVCSPWSPLHAQGGWTICGLFLRWSQWCGKLLGCNVLIVRKCGSEHLVEEANSGHIIIIFQKLIVSCQNYLILFYSESAFKIEQLLPLQKVLVYLVSWKALNMSYWIWRPLQHAPYLLSSQQQANIIEAQTQEKYK